MEIDIVDSDNVRIGTTDRSRVLDERRNFRTVHGIFHDPEGRFLFQRLSSSHPRSPGKLGSTVAGYLYSGETYAHGIGRIANAEIGIVPPELMDLPVAAMNDEGSKKFVKLFLGFVGHEIDLRDKFAIRMERYTWSELLELAASNSDSLTETLAFLIKQHAGVGVGRAGT